LISWCPRKPKVSGEDTLRAVGLADQVHRSLEGHRWDVEPAAVAAPAPMPKILEKGPLLRPLLRRVYQRPAPAGSSISNHDSRLLMARAKARSELTVGFGTLPVSSFESVARSL